MPISDFITKQTEFKRYPEPTKITYTKKEKLDTLKTRVGYDYELTVAVSVHREEGASITNEFLDYQATKFITDLFYGKINRLLTKLQFFVNNAELDKALKVIDEIREETK